MRWLLFLPFCLLLNLSILTAAGSRMVTAHRMLPVGGIQVVSASPAARTLDAPVNSEITVEFDRPVASGTINSYSFWAFGKWNGPLYCE